MGLRPCQNRNGHEKEEAVTPASFGKMLLQVIVDIHRRFLYGFAPLLDIKQMIFFPTSLRGVLVFYSVSRSRSSSCSSAAAIFHNQQHLSHNTVTRTHTHIFVTPPSCTHNFLTHPRSHTTLSHTHNFVTHVTHLFVTHSIFHADVHRRFAWHLAWQAWHLYMGLGWVWWRAWSPMVAVGAAELCVAGVALGHMCRVPSFCVAGVALGDSHLRFAWQAWR